ncbi:MAG: ammonium transporter [Paludibacteraceae bacterium]|nr:ammonium transporter [Paludibacteraceae bacterium]
MLSSLDTVWTLLAAMLVFFMQPGFALVEAGLTRSKNTANILMKNFCDFMAGTVLFWIIGFGLMFHGFDFGAFLFHGNYLDGDGIWRMSEDATIPAETFLMFQTVFAATTATIVSGAMAERTKFSMYLLYSVLISALIYPIEGSWSWGGGWLADLGFHDFAGSTVVHATGGVLALAGAIVLGPRIGKYKRVKGADGKTRTQVRAIPGHNLALCALGVFILWMGWFGFNPGSTIAAEGAVNALSMSHIMLTTNMAAAVGGIAALVYTWLVDGKPSLSMVCNGVLAGLVGITAGCDCVSIGAAALIGLVCSLLMCVSVWFIDQKLHIDDPVGAVSVHGVGGITGTILTGLFAAPEVGVSLWVQVVGALTVAVYAFAAGMLLFYGIRFTFGLRVAPRIEEEGLDIYEHGEAAYN